MQSLREMQNNFEYEPDMDCTSGELGLCSRQGEGFPFSSQFISALGPRIRSWFSWLKSVVFFLSPYLQKTDGTAGR